MNRILAFAFPAGVFDREDPSGRDFEVSLGFLPVIVLEGVKLALRDCSAASAAGPLRFFLCFLLSQRLHYGWAGVKADESSSHPQRSGGLGLDAIEPSRSTLRKNPRRKQRKQRDRCRPSNIADRVTLREEAQAARKSRSGNAGRVAKPPYLQERQRSAKPPRGWGRTGGE